jgi:hypothetical protein
MLARAIQGSNRLERYDVELDAAAALDDEEALSADKQTFAEIRDTGRVPSTSTTRPPGRTSTKARPRTKCRS